MFLEYLFYSDFGLILFFIPITAAIQTAVFHIFYPFLSKQKRGAHQWILTSFMLVLSLSLIICLYIERLTHTGAPEIIRILETICILITSIHVYFYFTSLFHPERMKISFIVSHCLPWAIICLVAIILHNYYPAPRIYSWNECFRNIHEPTVFLRVLSVIYTGIYMVNVIVFLIKTWLYLKHSSPEEKKIGNSILAFIILGILVYSYNLYSMLFLKFMFYIVAFAAIISVLILEYSRFKSVMGKSVVKRSADSGLWKQAEKEKEIPDSQSEQKKTKGQKEILTLYLEEKKAYLNQELSLINLAAELGTNRTYASILINKEFGISFYQLINKYRIAHAIELMKNKHFRQSTIDSLAYESGFKSKSVFYKQFKEIKGCSPSAYLHQIEAKNNSEIFVSAGMAEQELAYKLKVQLRSPED